MWIKKSLLYSQSVQLCIKGLCGLEKIKLTYDPPISLAGISLKNMLSLIKSALYYDHCIINYKSKNDENSSCSYIVVTDVQNKEV